ncbi:hypothetical protein [Paenibacillus sp. FJAT-26967]|uniref:hypothetical protein n=1 Tax=Paenibacillus sp. FJAT-26967 TaxID=1729690 RepID=UPI00083808F6|nr:hypothetical protein [Paenibacillus sp. FJAT-26967]
MHTKDLHSLCQSYMNRYVRVQTKSGQTWEGTLIHVDLHYVQIRVPGYPVYGQGEHSHGQHLQLQGQPGYGQGISGGYAGAKKSCGCGGGRESGPELETRAFFPPFGNPGYNDAILTLALFDLLTLVLLM